jgi:PhnB protein
MPETSIYLNFNENTEEAFNFYKSVFGGEFGSLMRWKDMPGSEKMSASDREKIMHISLPIGKSSVIAATDTLLSMGHKVEQGTNVHIHLQTESEEEANEFYKKLSSGGKEKMPMEKAFWGSYFGMLVDKFGIQWMILCDYKK